MINSTKLEPGQIFESLSEDKDKEITCFLGYVDFIDWENPDVFPFGSNLEKTVRTNVPYCWIIDRCLWKSYQPFSFSKINWVDCDYEFFALKKLIDKIDVPEDYLLRLKKQFFRSIKNQGELCIKNYGSGYGQFLNVREHGESKPLIENLDIFLDFLNKERNELKFYEEVSL